MTLYDKVERKNVHLQLDSVWIKTPLKFSCKSNKFRTTYCSVCGFNPLAPELFFFFNFSTPCIKNVNNTGIKQVSIMKQTAF